MFIAGAWTWYEECQRRETRHEGAYIFDYAFLGAYNVAIVEDVLCKVDVGRPPAMFYLLDGLFDVGLCDGHCRWERRKGVFGVVAGFK